MKSIHFHDKNLQAEVETVGVIKHIPANTVIMLAGDLIENIPLVKNRQDFQRFIMEVVGQVYQTKYNLDVRKKVV